MQEAKELSALERAQLLPPEDRILNVRNYLEFISEDLENTQAAIYIPINTVSPSELEGISLEDERRLRVYACEII